MKFKISKFNNISNQIIQYDFILIIFNTISNKNIFEITNSSFYKIQHISFINRTALHLAVMKKNAEIIECLLENNDINCKIKDDVKKIINFFNQIPIKKI